MVAAHNVEAQQGRREAEVEVARVPPVDAPAGEPGGSVVLEVRDHDATEHRLPLAADEADAPGSVQVEAAPTQVSHEAAAPETEAIPSGRGRADAPGRQVG
jgi:hypothetical protein